MSIVAHLETLEEKHARLEAAITEEGNRPSPDFAHMTDLKKLKLHIKEEMNRINHYMKIVHSDQKANAS